MMRGGNFWMRFVVSRAMNGCKRENIVMLPFFGRIGRDILNRNFYNLD